MNTQDRWVSAYRAYRVPSGSVSQIRPLIADFEQVRAMFLRWNTPYQKPDQNLIEQKDGSLTFEPHPLYVYQTGYGMLLLLITPLPDDYDGNDEDAAKERVGLIRSVMVALLGRNATYKHEFDVAVECAARIVGTGFFGYTTPADETPMVNKEGMDLVSATLEKLSSLDDSTQNRIRLALRWNRRSFGDDRIARDTTEGKVDDFINSWLALETLAMEGTTNIAPIKNMLAEIHSLDAQQAGDLFPIGRIYGLRGNILHDGQMQRLENGLIRFMTDVFSDLLLHILGLPSGKNTWRYLDGSARGLP